MSAATLRNATLGAGAALLLTFLFVQQRPVDPRQHHRFMHDLNLMTQLDTEISRDLLNSRFELLASYDPFVRRLEKMRGVEADLQHVPSFASGNARKQIEKLVGQESELLTEKARLLETFKSENGSFKNSLRYFPILMAEASRTAAAKKTGN